MLTIILFGYLVYYQLNTRCYSENKNKPENPKAAIYYLSMSYISISSPAALIPL